MLDRSPAGRPDPHNPDPYANDEHERTIKVPMRHDSAHKHVSGEALYIDDLPEPSGMLHVYPGLSERAHARITALDLGLVRSTPGVVLVLTGQLPTHPKTFDGEATMTGGEARYWSITGYADGMPVADVTTPVTPSLTGGVIGVPVSSVVDEQITTNANGRYIIVYSRPGDRPTNATAANNATWVDWGPKASVGLTLRWMSVHPEWSFCRAPDQGNLDWNASQSSPTFDPTLTAQNNNKTTFLGEYQPVVHYMTKAAFEALGNHALDPDGVPQWVDPAGQTPGPPVTAGPTGCTR